MKTAIGAAEDERADARIVRALGLDPHETTADSLTITPLGEGFAVKWQGIKIMSREEVLRAIEPEREARS